MSSNLLKNAASSAKSKNGIYYGTEDDVKIHAGAGEDLIYGGKGTKILVGGSGDDTIFSSGEADTVFGGTGNDVIFSTMSNGRIRAEEGNDTIWASGDNVTVDGGAGNDSITVVYSDGTVIFGGAGNDTIRVDALGNGAMMYGGAGDDTLIRTGDPKGRVEFRFALFNYAPNGSSVEWSENSEADNSTPKKIDKTSTSGNDKVVGFVKGVDKLVFEKNFGDNTTGGTFTFAYKGKDTIVTWTVDGVVMSTVTVVGVKIDSSDLSVTQAVVEGTESKNVLTDTAFNDRILAHGGNDTVNAMSGGADTIYGGAGNDTLVIKGQDGQYYGGSGNDIISGDSPNGSFYGGGGNDVMTVSGRSAQAWGEAGNDKITASIYNGYVYGGLGNDTITMTKGGDYSIVDAGDGNDVINVYAMESTVNAGAGNDTIRNHSTDAAAVFAVTGGAGNDVIYAGSAKLTYEFNLIDTKEQGNDVIYGFKIGKDKIMVTTDHGDKISISLSYNKTSGATLLKITNSDGTIITQTIVYTANKQPLTLSDIGTGSFGSSDTPGEQDLLQVEITEGGTHTLSNSSEFVTYAGADDATISLGGGNDYFEQQKGFGFVTLFGGAGNDAFSMQEGGILSGGAGADTFQFDGFGAEAALITDFEVGVDKLVLGSLPNRDFSDKLSMEIKLVYDADAQETYVQLGGVTLARLSGDYTKTALLDDVVVDANDIRYVGPSVAGYAGEATTGFNVSETVTNMTGTALSFSGGGGNDTMHAGANGDTMSGGVGNDALVGGVGNDKLIGGAGKDTFAFADGFGTDHVVDFTIGEDKLWFDKGMFKDVVALLQAVNVVDGHIQITQGTNAIIFDNLTANDLDGFRKYIALKTTFDDLHNI